MAPLRSLLIPPLMLAKRPMTLGVRAIVEDEAGRVLLVRHTYVEGWYLPGGGVEVGQTMAEALAMELAEEGNIVDAGDARLLGIYFNRGFSRRDHVAVFHCRNWRQDGPAQPNREIAEAGFFPLDGLPDQTIIVERTLREPAIEVNAEIMQIVADDLDQRVQRAVEDDAIIRLAD